MLLVVKLSPVVTTFVNVNVIVWPIAETAGGAAVGLSTKPPTLPTKLVAASSRAEPKIYARPLVEIRSTTVRFVIVDSGNVMAKR